MKIIAWQSEDVYLVLVSDTKVRVLDMAAEFVIDLFFYNKV